MTDDRTRRGADKPAPSNDDEPRTRPVADPPPPRDRPPAREPTRREPTSPERSPTVHGDDELVV